MKAIAKETALAVCGGCLYVVLELLWRGRSHWTMFILGGVCFVLIGAINEVIPWEMPLVLQGVIGSACIVTPLEFVTGCIVNLWLGWNVWDYSNIPFNVMGQICLLFSALWVVVSAAAVVLDDWLRYWLFQEPRPHYTLWHWSPSSRRAWVEILPPKKLKLC